MRKSIIAAAVLALPAISQAMPLNVPLAESSGSDTGRLVYNDGTRLEFNSFDLKLNLTIQDRLSYNDVDDISGRDGAEDSTDFSLRLVRVYLSGNTLDKQFSYKISNDFVKNKRGHTTGNQLEDAWLQYNDDEIGNFRMGQFKEPFGRQELAHDEAQQMLDRSLTSDFFAPGRRQGVMLHGGLADTGVNYAAGIFNGNSDGEDGINQPGVDNKIQGAIALNTNIGEYGSRDVEGDHRTGNRDFAATMGAAVLFGQGSTDVGDASSNFDKTDVNVDAGVRMDGWSGQGEFFYRNLDLKDIEGDAGKADDFGFYAQGGYMFDPEWELAFRFGWISADTNFAGNPSSRFESALVAGNFDAPVDTVQEYQAVINYFLNGHNLKVQGGVNWVVTNYDSPVNASGDDSTTDANYILQIAGYM